MVIGDSGVDPVTGFGWVETEVDISLCYLQGVRALPKWDTGELAKDIGEKGQLVPVVLYRASNDELYRPYAPKGYKYWIRDGHHRIEALKLLGRTKVLARVYSIPFTYRWHKMKAHDHKV